MIPFNDLKAVFGPYMESLAGVSRSTIESGWFVLGPHVDSFQKNFAQYIGTTDCFGVGNGTDALEIALRAVGVGAGDEVITVANAGGYTTSACISIGAIPVYCDIETSLLIDIDKIPELLSSSTKAIVVTHLYGQAVNVECVRKMVKDIPIVEDCAEAHGASLQGRKVGSLGDVGTFSFYPTKNLGALGDGGAITTSQDHYAENIRLLRQYGWASKYNSSIAYGRNSRLDELQAAFLNIMLENLEVLNKQRMEIFQQYASAAPEMFSHFHMGEGYVAHLAVAHTAHRDEFRELCTQAGIATDIHFPLLDCQQDSMTNIAYRRGGLSVSEKSVHNIVSLPCYPHMPQAHVDVVVETLRSWVESGKNLQ
ncbi:MAG TPA: DegT/DnrJ/EryC1/StrS family aminotransferase [Acidimicrobiia bacterium]|nr:DegT/DnrJ/EryC1/StrS family aminotransferase [Acidimicrobiia bacterium]